MRWHQLKLDASGLDSVNGLRQQFLERAQELFSDASGKLHAVRVILTGETPLHAFEAEEPGSMAAAIQASTQELVGMDVWIEQVQLELRSPFDRGSAALRDDAVGEVVKLADMLGTDDAVIHQWFTEQTRDMKGLPGMMSDTTPTTADTALMRSLLVDAEAMVLARLAGLTVLDGRS